MRHGFPLSLVVTLVLGAGCSAGENLGSSAAATTITPASSTLQYVSTNANPYQNNEPSCTWSPATRGDGGRPVWVCGFNDSNGLAGIGGNGATNFMGWSFSVDGITWTYCNPTLATCGLPPMVPGMSQWRGDPQLVADGEGNVAYISMADASPGDGALIVAALSTNGGKTFTNTVQVNMPFPNQPCYPAANGEDQPSADFDITTPSTAPRKLSVVWRHNGSGTYGACMRRGTFCATATSDPACASLGTFPNVAWESATGLDVAHLSRDNSFYGQSGVIVQAGDGAVAVVYANCDNSMVNCPNTNPQTCGWHRVVTYDGGNNWSDDATIDYTTTLQICVVNGGTPPNGGRIESRHRGTFAFARDRRNGDYYVATSHSKNHVLLFRSQNQGSSWAQINDFTGAPTLTLPVLASDTAGRLALEFIQSDAADLNVQPVFSSAVFDATPTNPSPAPKVTDWVSTPLVPFYNPGSSVRIQGDYNTIAVANPVIDSTCTATSTFMPAWTDPNSPPANDPFNVHVQQMVVTP